jgi:hypothetical protein
MVVFAYHGILGHVRATTVVVECVFVAFVNEQAKRMRQTISSVAFSALQHFFTSRHNRYAFFLKKLLNTKYVF